MRAGRLIKGHGRAKAGGRRDQIAILGQKVHHPDPHCAETRYADTESPFRAFKPLNMAGRGGGEKLNQLLGTLLMVFPQRLHYREKPERISTL